MSYQSPNIAKTGLKVETKSYTDIGELTSTWSQLIQDGYHGWAQWTGAVHRLKGGEALPFAEGKLIAGECYQGQVSYKLSCQGRRWRLTRIERTEGESHLMVERSFIKIEPGQVGVGENRGDPVTYELYWEASMTANREDILNSYAQPQSSPCIARLTRF